MASGVENKFEHAYSVLSVLNEMRNKLFICDFVIKCGEEIFPVHRAILAACSDFFVAKLTDDISDVNQGCIEIQDIESSAVKRSLEFLYTGEAYVTMDTVETTLEAAITMGLEGLIKICVRFLQNNLSLGNCLNIKTIALQFNLYTIVEVAQKYAMENFELVISTEGFKHLSIEIVMNFIENLTEYKKQWEAGISWIRRDVDERSKYLFTILQLITSGNCSFDFLFKSLWKESQVKESDDCANFVVKALLDTVSESVIEVGNCFELLRISKKYENFCGQVTKSVILNYMGSNFEEVSQQQDFKLLEETDALDIFQSQQIELISTEVKWKAATKWVDSGIATRKKHLSKIMRHFDLNDCGFDYLFNVIRVHRLVKKSGCCSLVAAEAIFSVMENTDITDSNWYELLQMAKKWSSTPTSERILEFVAANFSDIAHHKRFTKLSETDMKRIIQSPCVEQCNDETKWNALSRWVKGDSMNRKQILKELLVCCNLPRWSFKFLFNVLYNDSLIGECKKSEELVVSSFIARLERADINWDNWFHILKLPKESDEAVAKVHEFMQKNFEMISEGRHFIDLPEDDFMLILKEYVVETPKFDEKMIWKAVVKWRNNNPETNFIEILNVLRLRKRSFEFLYTTVYEEPLLKISIECREFIITVILSVLDYQNITDKNWFGLLQIAKKYQQLCAPVTLKVLNHFMATNYLTICRQNKFSLLEKTEMTNLLRSQPVAFCLSPSVKWASVTTWTEKKEERKAYFAEMLELLNLNHFPFYLLFKFVLEEQLVKETQTCVNLVVRALLFVIKQDDITVENCFKTMEFARKYAHLGSSNAIQYVKDFMVSQFGMVCCQTAYLVLKHDDIQYIFQSPALKIPDSLKIDAALSWVKESEIDRSQMLPLLFKTIRLHALTHTRLRTLFEDNLVRQSQECKDMITEALLTRDSSPMHVHNMSPWPLGHGH